MKDKDFDPDSLLQFKEIADKIKGLTDGSLDVEDFDFDEIQKSGIVDFFEEILSEELSKPFEPVSEDELYEEIVGNYFLLIKELGIENFNFFRFADYDYCREIIVDGKNYDLDGEFCHDDTDAAGALCAIDCLMADLGEEEDEIILKKVESMINKKNRK
ncbi:MAG: hypothetical protein ACI4SB_07005 [Acutalibacteraceae bacterium]